MLVRAGYSYNTKCTKDKIDYYEIVGGGAHA